MVKRVIALFIIITSLELFNFAFIGKEITKVAEIAGIGVILLVIVLQLIYHKGEGFRMTYKWEVGLILLALVTSMFMAYSAHNQNFQTTLIAQRFMYFYFFYYALHMLRIPDKELEKIILYLALIYVFFYIIQYFAYPTIIFRVRVIEERGTIRIFQVGLSYMILAYFYVLNRSFDKLSLRGIGMLFLFFSVIILMGTRQLLFSMFLLTMLNILMSRKVKSKLMVILLAMFAAIPVVLMFQDIFTSIISLSKEQSVGFEENIRVLAGTFFLTEFFPNNLAYLTGNGADSANSGYGMTIQMYKDVFGFYQSDVGIIGDYSKFGILFLAGVFSILYRTLKTRFSDDLNYIKYFFLFAILTGITGAGLFGEANSIVTISIILYLSDIDKHNRKLQEEDQIPAESDPDAVANTAEENPVENNYTY